MHIVRLYEVLSLQETKKKTTRHLLFQVAEIIYLWLIFVMTASQKS